MPNISVVLCTYNGEKYLEHQLDSILNQTIKPYEIIISDDSSVDGTIGIIEKYSCQYDFIKVYKNSTNIGFQKNFQGALPKSTGDFIAISDQDDIWDPIKLDSLLAAFSENVMLVYSDSEFVNSSSVKTSKLMSDKLNMIEGSNPLAFLTYNCVSGHALMLKRELLMHALPFPEFIFYDQWLAFVASLIGGLKYVNKPLVDHRRHSANSGIIWSEKKFSKSCKLINKIKALEYIVQFTEDKDSCTKYATKMLLKAEISNVLVRRVLRLFFWLLYGGKYFAIPQYSKFKQLKRIIKCKDY